MEHPPLTYQHMPYYVPIGDEREEPLRLEGPPLHIRRVNIPRCNNIFNPNIYPKLGIPLKTRLLLRPKRNISKLVGFLKHPPPGNMGLNLVPGRVFQVFPKLIFHRPIHGQFLRLRTPGVLDRGPTLGGNPRFYGNRFPGSNRGAP